jgi:hypothetical protein
VENLPFEVDFNDQLFVLHDNMTMRRFDNVRQVTALIEYVINECSGHSNVSVDNFAVLSGHVMSLGVLSSMMTRIGILRKMISE